MLCMIHPGDMNRCATYAEELKHWDRFACRGLKRNFRGACAQGLKRRVGAWQKRAARVRPLKFCQDKIVSLFAMVLARSSTFCTAGGNARGSKACQPEISHQLGRKKSTNRVVCVERRLAMKRGRTLRAGKSVRLRSTTGESQQDLQTPFDTRWREV